jgi:hypothetical protein
VSVQSGDVVDVAVNVHLFAGALQVVEQGSGTPFANTQLDLEPVHETVKARAVFRTDSNGSIQGLMAPGDYRARIWTRGAKSSQSERVIHWSASGPDTAQITLPAPK